MTPGLFLTQEDLAEVRARIEKHTWAADMFERIRTDTTYLDRRRALEAAEPDSAAAHRLLWQEGDWLRDQALVYAVSGDDAHVPELLKILDERFGLQDIAAPLDSDMMESWGFLLVHGRHVWAFDLLAGHPQLRGRRRANLEQRFEEILCVKKRIVTSWIEEPNNTGFWDVAALGVLGFLLNDNEAIRLAINGDYGFKKILCQLQDGCFWPEPPGYAHDYVSSCLIMLAEAALKNGGEDLYRYEAPGGKSIKSMIDGWIRMTCADGRVALSGDGSEHAAEPWEPGRSGARDTRNLYLFRNDPAFASARFEIAYRAYRDPAYAWVLSHNPRRDSHDRILWGYAALTHGCALEDIRPPRASSAVFVEYGSAMLRSDETAQFWDSDAPSVLVRKGNNMNHGHNDHFAIIFSAFRRSLYRDWSLSWDYCMGLFVDGRNKTPMTSTILGHNTVVVDRSEPSVHNNVMHPYRWTDPFTAEFSDVRRSGGATCVSLEGSVYGGVFQKRTLALTRQYLVDVFELRSEAVHTYDYLLHGFGGVALAGAGKMEGGHHLGEQYGLDVVDSMADDEHNVWLSPASRATIDGDWQAVFRDVDGTGVRAFVAGDAGTEVFLTTVPCFVGSPARLPFVIVRRAGRETNFVVVHQPFSGDPAPLRVERQGNELLISGEGFADTFDFATMEFRRSSA